MAPANRTPRRRRTYRRDWSFFGFVALLFAIGILVEMLEVTASRSGGIGWLWILPGVTMLIGLMWLVAREPANL